jgi:uncharacterized phage protein (TIGR01671 family)
MRHRPIKFRAWDKGLKRFVPFVPILLASLDDDKVHIFQQYTGVKDKNGREIYEGDIVKEDPNHITNLLSVKGGLGYTHGVITWLREAFCVCQPYIGGQEMSAYVTCNCCGCGLEVIGNILENPELCKSSS